MPKSPSLSPSPRLRLRGIRNGLLLLHKSLLFFERRRFEGHYGRIPSSSKFFSLTTTHPHFAWIRPLSELIVSIGGMLERKHSLTDKEVLVLSRYVRRTLRPLKTGNAFDKRYFEAMQKEPDVGLAHSRVFKLLSDAPKPGPAKES